MLRGEIWWGVWPNDPDRKPRPLLIVSNNFRNQAPRTLDVLVVKVTSLRRADGSAKPTNAAEDLIVQLKKPSIIKCGAIFTVEKSTLTGKAAQISLSDANKVDQLLKNALDLN